MSIRLDANKTWSHIYFGHKTGVLTLTQIWTTDFGIREKLHHLQQSELCLLCVSDFFKHKSQLSVKIWTYFTRARFRMNPRASYRFIELNFHTVKNKISNLMRFNIDRRRSNRVIRISVVLAFSKTLAIWNARIALDNVRLGDFFTPNSDLE